MTLRTFFFFLSSAFVLSLLSWNSQQSASIKKKITKNVSGSLEGTALEYITFNNGNIERIHFYKKPIDTKADPRFHSVEVSLVPSQTFPHIKQIIFIDPDPIKKKVRFGSESWYEVKLVYSNLQEEYLLLPTATKIYAKNTALNRLEAIEIPRLKGEGLVILGAKPVEEEQTIQN
jgi:hypothetical protein